MDYTSLTDGQLYALSQQQDLFVYELDFAALAAAGTATNSFTIQADSNFVWLRGSYQADIAAAAFTINTAPVPNITCLLTDTSSGRQFMSAAVPLSALFNNITRPEADLVIPHFFRANTTLSCTLVNYDAAVTYNVKLQFHGCKRYNYQQTHG